MAHLVEVTLDAMGWRGLHDDVDGGFFRCAATADWQDPRQEKTLEVNACVLRTLVEAADVLRIARYRERASDVIRYVQTWLADPVDGGWSGSQQGDVRYYSATAEARRQMVAPPVDPVLYTAWNGQMVSAMLRAAELLDDSGLGEFAVKSLERLTFTCYAPGAGIAHCLDQAPSVRGLLDDQVAMGSASLDVYTATGNVVYLMMAQELAHYAVRVMWDEQDGGFFDRSIPDADEAIGLMRERRKPFVANCDAARLLRRLSATKGRPRLRQPCHRHLGRHGAAGPIPGALGGALPPGRPPGSADLTPEPGIPSLEPQPSPSPEPRAANPDREPRVPSREPYLINSQIP